MSKKIIDILSYISKYPRYIYALWRLSRIETPLVTIFGGRNVPTHHLLYKKAFELSFLLQSHSISVITGGGPGIMDAALCGAYTTVKKNVLGIEVMGVDSHFFSSCNIPKIRLPDFSLRKSLLIEYSEAFVVFPGGIGTLNEVSEVLTLIKAKKLSAAPVILIGSRYWKFFQDWIYAASEEGFLLPGFQDSFLITDDLEEVLATILKHSTMKK